MIEHEREVDILESGEEQLKLPIEEEDYLVFNPLLKYPRNAPCICESGKKWKKCHGPLAQARVPRSQALEAMKIVKNLIEARARG